MFTFVLDAIGRIIVYNSYKSRGLKMWTDNPLFHERNMRTHNINLELTYTEAQLLTTACRVVLAEWQKGDTRSKLAASILLNVETELLQIMGGINGNRSISGRP